MKNYLIHTLLLIFLSACGVKSVTSSSVQAEIVSVAEYKDYSCKELALDALNIQNKIPLFLKHSFISSEDQRFYKHY